MAVNLKDLTERPERLTGGHRLCAGCGASVVARAVMRALKPEDKAVVGAATGCLEVSTCIYPYTAWKDSFIHSAFENVGATVSGAEAAYKAMKKRGRVKDNYKFIAFAGDGGTYDIGLQSLSGAMERGHDMVYVCYDNGAYMNTGIQRSSATPKYADTTTSPAGDVIPGKPQYRKDLAAILAAHHIPYVAQTAPFGNFNDIHSKAEKAIYTEGPTFLNVLAPCPRGWRYDTPKLMEITKLAMDTCFWPIFEVENGNWKLNYKPKTKLPIEEYLKTQGRFSHLFEEQNKHLIEDMQKEIDRHWEILLERCGEK